MPLFSRFKSKGTQPVAKGKNEAGYDNLVQPKQTKWQARWESTSIVPDEVQELVHVCTTEMKNRAEALDAPFLLLPFRPDTDPSSARTFIRNYYKSNAEQSSQYLGDGLRQELRLTDSVVLCSILKWCWSRMPNGVVSWSVYEGFRIGEREAQLARNAFTTFIPIGAESEARRAIIFDFFDLLAAVAAHGKMNGLTGRKLSRLAGWWAFDHSDDGKGFEGGYKSWTAAADASSHLFFAYLRSLSPDIAPSMNVIERIPRALQALIASTEYPPETPTLLQRSTPCVVMLVDTVSPTPFALLRRAKHFEYRDRDRVLREFAEFEDPVDALTEECKRVLYAVSSANQSTVARSRQGLTMPEESWNAFSNLGFAELDQGSMLEKNSNAINGSNKTVSQSLRDQPVSRSADAGRPTTPSWAEFLSSGFADDGSAKSPTLLYPPTHVLPPLGSRSSTPGHHPGDDETLAPGELAAIKDVELDDAFWWVWMISLAGEEPSSRKAVFGRCALIETTMKGSWLIMEEQVKGASPDPLEGVFIAPKRGLFSFSKRGRTSRKRMTIKQPPQEPLERTLSATPSKISITTDQQAKIKAAAKALTHKQETLEPEASRRGRHEDVPSTKTNSMLTMGLQSEAGPAMKWASSYDKSTVRAQYLGDSLAGKGVSREDLGQTLPTHANGESSSTPHAAAPATAPVAAVQAESVERNLPAVPKAETMPATSPPETHLPIHEELDHVAESQEPTLDFNAAHQDAGNAPPPELARPASSRAVAEHQITAEPSSPVTPTKYGRKPVPSTAEHPVLSTQAVHAEQQSVSPVANPAAAAAARAMQSAAVPGSDTGNNKSKKQAGSNNGFKKLFGKKKDSSSRGDSHETSQSAGNTLTPPSEHGFGRRLSIMRKKQPQNAAPLNAEPAPAGRSDLEHHVQEPTVTSFQTDDFHVPATMSRSSINEHEAAEKEFSRFDQGPMEDMPAAMPAESDHRTSTIPEEHDFNTLAASRLHPQIGSGGGALPYDAPTSDVDSEVTMEDHHDASVVQDRWATIRENAHKRAAQRGSEEQSTQSRPSQSLRTDDGETSGEETIESRVARIKARVAELTGNMDNAARA